MEVRDTAPTGLRIAPQLSQPPANDVAWALAPVERSASSDAITTFEVELAAALELEAVACIWIDWAHRRAWSPTGEVTARLLELVVEAAGSGRRAVIDNAIIEPIGGTPALTVLVFRGSVEQLFRPHTLRAIARLARRLAPVFDRFARDV